MFLDYLFLPIVFLVGFITAYQDFKIGKIKNKWVILGLYWGLGIYFVLCLWLLLGHYFQIFAGASNYISFPYIFNAFLNSALALVVGYMIWHFDLWSAGDAKLFFVFSLLLPLAYYRNNYLPYFPSFALLINVFIPALLFLLLQGIFLLAKDTVSHPIFTSGGFSAYVENGKKYFKKKYSSLGKSFVTFSLIFILFRMFHQFAFVYIGKYQWFFSFSFLLFFSASKFLRRILMNTYVLCLALLAFVGFLSVNGFGEMSQVLAEIKSSLVLLITFPLVALVFDHSQKRNQRHDMPFAAWIFLGVVLTIILKGSAISALSQLLGKGNL